MKRSLTALLAFVVALCASFALCTPAWAGALPNGQLQPSSGSTGTATIGDIETESANYGSESSEQIKNTVWEGLPARISFSLSLAAPEDDPFSKGGTIEVSTNIGSFFKPLDGWDKYDKQSIVDKDGSLLATVEVVEEGTKLIFTIEQDGLTVISNAKVQLPALTVRNDVVLGDEAQREDTLKIDGTSKKIVFNAMEEPEKPTEGNPGLPDVDTFWKSAWSCHNYAGSTIRFEVNSIGSIDLYGSTTYTADHQAEYENLYGEAKYPNVYPRAPKAYKNLFVEDQIPEKGIIDVNSVVICASIPGIAKDEDTAYIDEWHMNYYIPKGVYYATRNNTLWQPLDGLTQLVQNEGEAKGAFKKRLKEKALQWGIYEDEDGNQTFLCNFGNVGKFDDGTVSNGVTYQDYAVHLVDKYPDIFGSSGASAGNVVSYHVEFNAYYPDVDITTTSNTATLYADDNSGNAARVGGNTSDDYTIINAAGIGAARKNSLELLLVDRDEKTETSGIKYQKPIEGGQFTIQKKNDSGTWEDVSGKKDLTTNKNGRITVTNFDPGTYRVIQTGWAEGYFTGKNSYLDPWGESQSKPGSPVSLEPNTLGEFTISEDQKYGYGVLVQNWQCRELKVSKVWEDSNNQDGLRPSSIDVKLLANDKDTGKVLKLSSDNSWKGTFTDLDKYCDGKEITYSVAEESVDGYETEIDGDASKGFTITNTHVPETRDISGSKTWDDNNDQDGKRPDSITIRLLADGDEVKVKTVTAEDDWKWSFTELPEYSGGKKIVYTITEDDVSGYTAKVDGFNVTNTHTPSQTSVAVTKIWNDMGNQDGLRPAEIAVELLEDGKFCGRTLKLNSETNWTGFFSGLDEYKDGNKITYTIREVSVDGYDGKITGDASTGFVITNSHIPAQIDLSGSKTWDDADDQDGKRPESIHHPLLADGDEVKVKTVTAEDDWKWSFTGLPKYENGSEIRYTVTEDAVPGYQSELNGMNVTNRHTPGQINVSVTKKWQDQNDSDGIRPDSIVVKLYADGEDTGKELVLNPGEQPGRIVLTIWTSTPMARKSCTPSAEV